MDLIEEDLNTSVAVGSKAGDESSEEDEGSKRLSAPEEAKVAAPPKVYEEDYTVPPFLWHFEEVPDWSERIAAYTDE